MRDEATGTKEYDIAAAPRHRVVAYHAITDAIRADLDAIFMTINAAAIQRQIQAVNGELIALATASVHRPRSPPRHHGVAGIGG